MMLNTNIHTYNKSKSSLKAAEKEIEDFQKQSADFDKWMLKILIITIMLSLVFVSYLIVNL